MDATCLLVDVSGLCVWGLSTMRRRNLTDSNACERCGFAILCKFNFYVTLVILEVNVGQHIRYGRVKGAGDGLVERWIASTRRVRIVFDGMNGMTAESDLFLHPAMVRMYMHSGLQFNLTFTVNCKCNNRLVRLKGGALLFDCSSINWPRFSYALSESIPRWCSEQYYYILYAMHSKLCARSVQTIHKL